MMGRLLSCLLLIPSLTGFCQDWKFVSRSDLGQTITALDVDEFGNVYAGTERGNVYSFKADGPQDRFYSSSVFGPVTSIDGSNALRVLVFYKDSGELEFLERFSVQARTYQTTDFGINSADYVRVGQDGTIWFLADNRLIQVNQQTGQILGETYLSDYDIDGPVTAFRSKPTVIFKTSNSIYFQWMNDLMRREGFYSYAVVNNEIWMMSDEIIRKTNLITGLEEDFKPPNVGFGQFVIAEKYFHFSRGEELLVYEMVK